MTTPVMHPRELVAGAAYSWEAAFTLDGAAINMTGKYAILRVRRKGGSTLFTRSTATSGHFTWTDETAGTGEWYLSNAFTLSLAADGVAADGVGHFDAEVFLYDSDGSRRRLGKTVYTVRYPYTGEL